MALANLDLGKLQTKVRAAYETDRPALEKHREFARRLSNTVRPLRRYSVNAVSFVASDGGDNRLAFNPAVVELIRVVDSRGNECALDAISGSAALTDLERRSTVGSGEEVQPLVRLCNDLGLPLRDLSYLLRSAGQPGKSTGAVRCYRDIIEWAVLYDLAANPGIQWGGDTILVRDGLLRTKSFRRDVFPAIDQRLRQAFTRHRQHNVALSLVGVAKQNAVLSRLALALEIEGVFHRTYPCYCEVPAEIEQAMYNFDRTWLDTFEIADEDAEGNRLYQSLGQLFLVKFGDQPLDPIWPVDVAIWQKKDAEKILGQLTVDAQQGFPIPDYPMCIQRAHDFAKLGGLEVQVLQDLLVDGACAGLTSEQSERLLRMKYLGQNLSALRYKEA
jgi:hypothetical protein